MKRGDLEEDGEKFPECEGRLQVLLGNWGGVIISKDRDGWLVRDSWDDGDDGEVGDSIGGGGSWDDWIDWGGWGSGDDVGL